MEMRGEGMGGTLEDIVLSGREKFWFFPDRCTKSRSWLKTQAADVVYLR
jgi:hypothetical protein